MLRVSVVRVAGTVPRQVHRPGMGDMGSAAQPQVTPMRRFAPFIVLVVIALVNLVGATPASAHSSTDGSTIVAVDDRRIVVTASVVFEELGYVDTSGDGLIDAEEIAEQDAAVAQTLVDAVRDRVELRVDGERVDIIAAGVPSMSEFGSDDAGASPYAVLVLATGPHDGDVTHVEFEWGFDGPSTTVVLSDADGAVTGDLGDDGTIDFSLDTWSSAVSFFELGIDHIRSGPDHLLFLLVLTVAVAGATVNAATTRRTIELVTAFTLGHAVSLALAYFDLVSVPAWIVEPAISLSIVAAAALAIRGRTGEARPWIAGLVGLVHGLGFASSLGSLGVVTAQRVPALAAFNLGIDVAQTVFVLLVIGALWLVGQLLAHRVAWVRVAIASSAAMFGVVWTVARLAAIPA